MRLLALLFVPLAQAAAGDLVSDAADRVLEALASGESVATVEIPDPWLVADEICARGKAEEALAFARSREGPDTERLAEYVASRTGAPPDEGGRRALAEADAARFSAKPQAAVEILEGAPGPFSGVLRCRLAFTRGFALAELGRRATSSKAFRDAAGAASDIGWLAGAVATLNQAGTMSYLDGDFAAALADWEARLAIEERRRSDLGRAESLSNIGLVFRDLGDRPRARAAEERALALARGVGHAPTVAVVLGNLAPLHAVAGAYEDALACQTERIALCRELGSPRGLMEALIDQGLILEKCGKPAESRDALREAYSIAERGGDVAGMARAASGIGIAWRALGEHAQAIEAWEQAAELADAAGAKGTRIRALWGMAATRMTLGEPEACVRLLRAAEADLPGLMARLDEGTGAGMRELWAPLSRLGARAALHVGDRESLCHFLERGRAGGLLESLGNPSLLETAILPEGIRREEEAARAAERAARKGYAAAVARENRAGIAAQREALDRAMKELDAVFGRTRRAAKAGMLSINVDSLATIRARLKPGEAFVLYGLDAKESVALVLMPEGERAVALVPEGQIVEAPTERLAGLLIEPLGLPAQVTRLLISPDGPLARLPFALFCGEREVAYVPSGTAYGLLLGSAGARGTRVLALGDPDYAAPADGSRLAAYWSGGAPGALPSSRTEAKAVGDTLLLGPEATKPRLLAALRGQPRWRAIHLACHARVNPTRPLQSSLALSGDFLTCMDILRNRLPCDLVVLSACESAGGKSYSGEGILGFTSACLSAGAPRVLVSLWKVDDAATAALMEKFYSLWNPKEGAAGLPAATALRRAQEFVASNKEWSDPRFWAAWQLWGLPE